MNFFNFLLEHWNYAIIPFISAAVGWFTNVMALRMTFYPLEFKGIPPYLGWQGIIPSKAGAMAAKSVDLITSNLIKIEDQFAQIDAKRVVMEMEPELERVSHKIIEEVMQAQANTIWSNLPGSIKLSLRQRVAEDLPRMVERLMEEIKLNINELFDLKGMVITTLLLDKQLLNEMFLKCGEKEFKFIEKSGAYFGFIFGLIQMVVWYYFQPWWLLPAAGLVVGYTTNWIALKLIFHPRQPWTIGGWKVQGLFIKRQSEVSEEYASMVAQQILSSPQIFDYIFFGSSNQKVIELIHRYVTKVVDLAVGSSKEMVQLIAGEKKYQVIKNIAFSSFMEDLRITINSVFSYADEALDLENTLRYKMQCLSPTEFSGFLRPVFQEDEWKLIAVGAFLGALAGLCQYFLLF